MIFTNHFQEQFEQYSCRIEIEMDGCVQQQAMEAPRVFLEQQFLSLVQQAASVARPVRVKMIRTERIWSQYDQRYIPQEYALEFTNNAYEHLHEEGS